MTDPLVRRHPAGPAKATPSEDRIVTYFQPFYNLRHAYALTPDGLLVDIQGEHGAPEDRPEDDLDPDVAPEPLIFNRPDAALDHFDGYLVARSVSTRLDGETAKQVRQRSAIEAPEGRELVAFVLRAGIPGFIESGEQTAGFRIINGDLPIRVVSPFGRVVGAAYEVPYVMFVLSVPKGGPVLFQVDDIPAMRALGLYVEQALSSGQGHQEVSGQGFATGTDRT